MIYRSKNVNISFWSKSRRNLFDRGYSLGHYEGKEQMCVNNSDDLCDTNYQNAINSLKRILIAGNTYEINKCQQVIKELQRLRKEGNKR